MRARTASQFFFLMGLCEIGTEPRDVVFGENIWNSLTTLEQEQEAYLDSVPILGQQLEERFTWSSRSTSRQVLFDAQL